MTNFNLTKSINEMMEETLNFLHESKVQQVLLFSLFDYYILHRVSVLNLRGQFEQEGSPSIENECRSVKGCEKSFAMKCFVFL